MASKRVYYDSDGCPMRLWELVRKEPDWAVSRIRASEKAEADLTASQAREVGLREALEFYADPDTYFAIGFFPDSPCGEFINDFDEVEPDYFKPGVKARAALSLPAPDLGERT